MNFYRRQLVSKARALRNSPPADPVPSPCVSICRMEAGVCEGCLRTLEEIAAWSTMADEDKREVWTRIEVRAAEQERA